MSRSFLHGGSGRSTTSDTIDGIVIAGSQVRLISFETSGRKGGSEVVQATELGSRHPQFNDRSLEIDMRGRPKLEAEENEIISKENVFSRRNERKTEELIIEVTVPAYILIDRIIVHWTLFSHQATWHT